MGLMIRNFNLWKRSEPDEYYKDVRIRNYWWKLLLFLYHLSLLKPQTMVLILDVISEVVAHGRSIIINFICLRLLIRSRSGTIRIFFLLKDLFSFMHGQHVLSYHIILVPCPRPWVRAKTKSWIMHNTVGPKKISIHFRSAFRTTLALRLYRRQEKIDPNLH